MDRVPANTSPFTLCIKGQPDQFNVLAFQGTEAISDLVEYQIDISCEDNSLPLPDLLFQNTLLTLHGEYPRLIHGVINHVEQLDTGLDLSRYRIWLAPRLSCLQQRFGQRIFQLQSVPEVVGKLLKEAGFQSREIDWQLQGNYSKRDYLVQYAESEYAFLHRLITQEGIHFHFEHLSDCHRLVFADSNAAFQTISGELAIRYCQETRVAKDQSSIQQLSCKQSVAINQVSLRDYQFKKPNLNLAAVDSSIGNKPFGLLESYQYRSPSAETTAELKRYQRIIAQRRLCETEQIQFRTDDPRLAVGNQFAVKEHPNVSLNQSYLLHRYKIQGELPQSAQALARDAPSYYRCDGCAIPVHTTYRAAQQFDRPRIKGVQTAVVTGPDKNEVYSDEYGRIKIQFHWDRTGQGDQSSSCWVRVSQGLAGKQWGTMMLPRVGQEVIVTFEEGDPALPLVTGALHNGVNRPPFTLPQQKMVTGIKTRTLGGNGFNEIRIDDSKANEKIFIRAEKNMDVRIQQDSRAGIGGDYHSHTRHNQFNQVSKDSHCSARQQAQEIGQQLSLQVDKDFHLSVSGARLIQVGNQLHIKGGLRTVIQADTRLCFTVGGSFISLDRSGVAIAGPVVRINEGGSAVSARGAVPDTPDTVKLPESADDTNTAELSENPNRIALPAQNSLAFNRGAGHKFRAPLAQLRAAARQRAAILEVADINSGESSQ